MEPFGFPAADRRHGMLVAMTAAAGGAKGVEPRAFMYDPPEEPEPTPEEFAKAVVKMMGAREVPRSESLSGDAATIPSDEPAAGEPTCRSPGEQR